MGLARLLWKPSCVGGVGNHVANTGGAISGEFVGGSHHGTLEGTISEAGEMTFIRDLGDRQQRWVGRLTDGSSQVIGNLEDPTHSPCSFEAQQRVGEGRENVAVRVRISE